MGTHILGIKDMAGLCKPYAAHALVKALRDEVPVPIHFHTHDTSGINAGSVLRASDAGVDIADAALASMSGMTSQPNLNSLVAALENAAERTLPLPASHPRRPPRRTSAGSVGPPADAASPRLDALAASVTFLLQPTGCRCARTPRSRIMVSWQKARHFLRSWKNRFSRES